MSAQPRQRIFAALIGLSVGIVVVMLYINVRSGQSKLSADDIHWADAGIAACCMLGLLGCYAVAWGMLLRALGAKAPVGSTVRVFLLTWPGRYAPASLPFYGGRLAAANKLGIARDAVAASLVYENLFAIAASGMLGTILLGARLRDNGGTWVWLAVTASVLAVAALQPPIVRFIVEQACRRVPRLAPLSSRVVPGFQVATLLTVYLLGALCTGFAFYFSVRAVGSGEHIDPLVAIGSYNLAGVAGMLALAVPSGLGVREAVAVALTGAFLSPPVALAAVVLVRLAGVVADLLPFAIISIGIACSRAWNRPHVEGTRTAASHSAELEGR